MHGTRYIRAAHKLTLVALLTSLACQGVEALLAVLNVICSKYTHLPKLDASEELESQVCLADLQAGLEKGMHECSTQRSSVCMWKQ